MMTCHGADSPEKSEDNSLGGSIAKPCVDFEMHHIACGGKRLGYPYDSGS